MFNAHILSLASLFATAAVIVTTNGAAVDVQNFLGLVKIVLDSTAGTGTAPTLDIKLQDSADGTTGWTDISGAVFAQVTNAAASLQSIGLDIEGARKFIRGVATLTGTSPSFTFSLNLLGNQTQQ